MEDDKNPEPKTKYVIRVDDGNDNGVLSITHYKAVSYEVMKNGTKFVTTDGKEHFTTDDVMVKEL